MTLTQSLSECFKKAFITTGRATRSEFWWMALVCSVCFLAYLAMYTAFVVNHDLLLLLFILPMLAVTAILSPVMYAVSIRRLQDTNRSGWTTFLCAIPLIGIIILIVFLSQKGTVGSNKYGEEPW